MIVCSCNVLSDDQIRCTVARATRRPRMSQIYADLGGSARCGQCARVIRQIMKAGQVEKPATGTSRRRDRP